MHLAGRDHTRADIKLLWKIFAKDGQQLPTIESMDDGAPSLIPEGLRRTSAFLTHPVFNTHHSETGMLRYIRQLSDKDLALDRTMIPLGSCTMKLNATSEMIPITWPEFADVHPFAPADQLAGYAELDALLRRWLCQATGYAGVSLQPNAGSQGEYAGLLAIKAYHEAQGHAHRNVCLIPSSAHGTNPASAQMVGMQVVVTKCDESGNVDMADLRAKCEQHSQDLACVMITYPSTHGVFETQVKELCQIVHQHGGRVYVDGANMNPGRRGGARRVRRRRKPPEPAQRPSASRTRRRPRRGPGVRGGGSRALPARHATAGIAGGGRGQRAPPGQRGRAAHQLDVHPHDGAGLTAATEAAILSANYISARLKDHYPTLYASANGHVAHECILDLRQLKETSGVMGRGRGQAPDRLRLSRAPRCPSPWPTHSWSRPTESETLAEIDRFIDAMIAIREEIRHGRERHLAAGRQPAQERPAHGREPCSRPDWPHPYAREAAAYPVASLAPGQVLGPRGAAWITCTATATCSAAACPWASRPETPRAPRDEGPETAFFSGRAIYYPPVE
ncbi:glycine dehydrogenase [Alicycliphilus sp. B1]|nr:glycine dehydrogenase [Alicycliphilus sp. B1]